MVTDVKTPTASRQEFIDLLSRITKPDEETTTIIDENNGRNVTINDNTLTMEEGEIITLNNDDNLTDKKQEIEDGEITESPESDVCIKKKTIFEFNYENLYAIFWPVLRKLYPFKITFMILFR